MAKNQINIMEGRLKIIVDIEGKDKKIEATKKNVIDMEAKGDLLIKDN